MATDSVLGLFTDPAQYAQQQSAGVDQRAAQFAQMTPLQQAQFGIYGGANRLAGGFAGMMGVQDPQMQAIAQQKSLLQNVDFTDIKSLQDAARQATQVGRPDLAQALATKALEVRNVESQISGRTEEKQAQREMQMQLAREKIQAQIDMAKERGATQLQIAQMQIDGRNQLAQLAAALKSEKAPTVDDKAATRIGQNTVFDTLINEGAKLTEVIDKNKDAFSLGGRASTAIKSVMNPSAPSVQAVSDVDSYLKKARNAYLLAAKGTQTEGDAQRAWEEFAGRLDFSSAEGAKRSVERIQTELSTQKQANEAYLKSRGVSSGAALGTKENPIKLK